MQPARRPKGGLAAVPWTTLTEFRGETGLADSWPTNGPPLVWEKQIGTGYSAPSVRSNWLILHHRLGDEEIVEAFEPATENQPGVTPTPADSLILTGSITVPAARRCSPKISVTLSRRRETGVPGVAHGQIGLAARHRRRLERAGSLFRLGSSPILEETG